MSVKDPADECRHGIEIIAGANIIISTVLVGTGLLRYRKEYAMPIEYAIPRYRFCE
jgi:hypothetical protein